MITVKAKSCFPNKTQDSVDPTSSTTNLMALSNLLNGDLRKNWAGVVVTESVG
jgi:hypothetical protein